MSRSELQKQGPSPVFDCLAEMCGKQLGHFEHGDLIFAKDGLELGVRVDIAFICSVLKAVCLDVFPDLFCDLSAQDCLTANDGSQFRGRG
jgi:hypothetical protein